MLSKQDIGKCILKKYKYSEWLRCEFILVLSQVEIRSY